MMHKTTRILLLCSVMVGCSALQADTLRIFDSTIEMAEGCQVRYQQGDAEELLDPEFNDGGSCRIVTHDDTSVPQLVYVNGMYVLIVEANFDDGSDCHSEYRGLGVSPEGEPTWSIPRRSGSCFFGKDLHEFEYLSNTM